MLQMIGFKNTWSEKKDKHGNIKVDEKGMPILNDMRNDFSSAIRCLRNTIGFVEGKNFNDSACHFIVQKAAVLAGTAENQRHGGAGKNKQSLWIRKDAFEKWTHVYKITGKTSKNIKNGMVYFIHMENNL